MEYFLSCGHTFWLENSCNSPVLAQVLKSNNKHCTGVLCANRKIFASLIKRCLVFCVWGSKGTCLAGLEENKHNYVYHKVELYHTVKIMPVSVLL